MKKKIIGWLILIVIAAGLLLWLSLSIKKQLNGNSLVSVSVKSNPNIDRTPIEISSIRKIGQWEFLSIKTEEMVDSVKKGIFFDDRLICIYKGKLSLGINMEKFDASWFRTSGTDSIALTLPPVTLLDQNFINEAETNVFDETGKWSEKEKEELYQRARQKMMRRALSPENKRMAEEQARVQMTQLMQSFGFQHVDISFRK